MVPPSLNIAAEIPLYCPRCGAQVPVLGAEQFAFNSTGACPDCEGTGIVRVVDESTLVPDESLSINEGAVLQMCIRDRAKAGDKLGLPTKVETNGSDGAKNVLTRAEIAACDGIIVAADKNVETARFDGKPVLFARVDDGIHKPEELLKKVAHGEVSVYHAKGGTAAAEEETSGDSFGRKVYKDLMNGVSHMLPFVVGGGIMIALAFLLDDYTIDPSNFGMNTPIAAFFKTVGSAAFGYMLPILAGFIAMSIADRPGLAVGFAGGVLAMNGTNFCLLYTSRCV